MVRGIESGVVAQIRTKEEYEVDGNIFSSYLERGFLFKNREILSAGWFPEQILHRDDEIRALSAVLAPCLKGYKPNNILVYGTIGTGKTITTRFVLDQMEKVGMDGVILYLNCKMRRVADTEYRMLARMLRELGVVVPETGLSTGCLYERFFDVLGGRRLVLALDEIDWLVRRIGDDFLYNLTRCEAEITVIGITNDLGFRDRLDSRVRSSLAAEEIMFKPYNALQIRDILFTRAQEAFHRDVGEVVINKIAAIAAQECGDARRAIELLRVAAEVCERCGDECIQERHVDMADEKINMDRIYEGVRGQPRQSQLVLAAIISLRKENNEWRDSRILSGDVYKMYQRMCAASGMKVLTERRIYDLINELEMLGLIESRVISKGRYGRNREIRLLLDEQMTERVEGMIAGLDGVDVRDFFRRKIQRQHPN